MFKVLVREFTSRFVLAVTSSIATVCFLSIALPAVCLGAENRVSGRVSDPQGDAIPGASVRLVSKTGISKGVTTDATGHYEFVSILPGPYTLTAEAPGFAPLTKAVLASADQTVIADLHFSQVAARKESIVITAKTTEPTIDFRNSETFNRTLFTRDDQVLQQLNAGINAGQHEGGASHLKSDDLASISTTVASTAALKYLSMAFNKIREPKLMARDI